MKFWLAACTAFALSIGPGFAQSQSDSSIPTIPATQIEPRKVATPFEFVATASSSNAFEIEAAQIALKKTENAGIKAMAQTLLDDHKAAQAELLAAGKSEKVDVAEPKPDGEQQGMLAKLDPPTGVDFDRLYLETQIFAHQRAISLFKGYAEGQTPLAMFAGKTLPSLVHHYEMAIELSRSMDVKPAVQ